MDILPRIMKITIAWGMVWTLACLLVSCGGDRLRPKFDPDRAFDLLLLQTDIGPRNPGSQGWAEFQTMLGAFLDSLNIEYKTQPFTYNDYIRGDTLRMVNWIARINPDEGDRILIGAHYDCRPRADYAEDPIRRDEPILGANDGASGVAVLMHLAELMKAAPPRVGVDLVFFDGEDYGPPERHDQFLLGSKYFASNHNASYAFGIIIDMIGDRDLAIYREVFSERYVKEINDLVWQTAARLNVTAFVDSVKHNVIDDHLPLIAADIPTVDLIDFDYPHWHTHRDTPDKCAPASLDAVGRVLVDIIYGQ